MLDTLEEVRRKTRDGLLRLTGDDPFAGLMEAAEGHRVRHGEQCGLYPAGPLVMSLAATFARACGARRVLDLGAGIGYSTLWLADAAEHAEVTGVDRFEEHVRLARGFARHAGVSDRVHFVQGEVAEVILSLEPSFDLIHDDAWFALEPPYLENMLRLLRPGGVLTMPNWFLLEDAIIELPRQDWTRHAGAKWAAETLKYAERLAHHPKIDVTWVVSPPLGVAIKRS
jgi:predicted O-methyltransferase YrrM